VARLQRPDGDLSRVSGASPYPSGCQGQQTGTDFLDYAVEVTSSLDPAGMLVSRSTDGGFTWGAPVAVASDSDGDDKETITADTANSNYVYAVWDNNNAGAVLTRTSDGGATWSHPKAIYNAACCNQIVVLPNGHAQSLSSESGSAKER